MAHTVFQEKPRIVINHNFLAKAFSSTTEFIYIQSSYAYNIVMYIRQV